MTFYPESGSTLVDDVFVDIVVTLHVVSSKILIQHLILLMTPLLGLGHINIITEVLLVKL